MQKKDNIFNRFFTRKSKKLGVNAAITNDEEPANKRYKKRSTPLVQK